MTDREAFLTAIKAQPADDTARLVFADWLDEHGTTDQDVARAEFIRLSCKPGITRQEKATGKWLDANWQRLLPAVCAAALPAGATGKRRGRTIDIRVPYHAHRSGIVWDVRVPVRFWRGFVDSVEVDSPKQFLFFAGLLRRDDPVVVPDWRATHLAPLCDELSGRFQGYRLNRGTWGPMFEYLDGADRIRPSGDTRPEFIQAKDWLRISDLDAMEEHAKLYKRLMGAIHTASLRWMDTHPGEVWLQMPRLNWMRINPPLTEPGWEEVL